MKHVVFDEVVYRANTKEDRFNTDKKYYVGGEHINSEDVVIDNRGLIEGSTIGPMFYFGFKKGDVLYVSRNPHLRKAGMVTFDGICSEKTFVLESKDESVLLQSYLPFVMQTEKFWNYVEAHKSGSVNYFVNWSALAKYEFDLPDIEEQKKISELLWSIVETKKAYSKMIDAIDEYTKSKFVELFADLMKDNSKCSTIETVCDLFADGDWIESKDQSESGIRLIQTGNVGIGVFIDKGEKARYISEDTFERLNCTEVVPGDILISRLPDPVGRACIIPEGLGKTITAVDCSIARLNKTVLSEYFVAFTMTDLYGIQIRAGVTGSTRKRISRKKLGQIKIPVPSIEQQTHFAEIARRSEKSKSELLLAIESLNNMYKGFLSDSLY